MRTNEICDLNGEKENELMGDTELQSFEWKHPVLRQFKLWTINEIAVWKINKLLHNKLQFSF